MRTKLLLILFLLLLQLLSTAEAISEPLIHEYTTQTTTYYLCFEYSIVEQTTWVQAFLTADRQGRWVVMDVTAVNNNSTEKNTELTLYQDKPLNLVFSNSSVFLYHITFWFMYKDEQDTRNPNYPYFEDTAGTMEIREKVDYEWSCQLNPITDKQKVIDRTTPFSNFYIIGLLGAVFFIRRRNR